jgi:hypothetical protein
MRSRRRKSSVPSKEDIDKAVTQLQKEMSSPEFKKALDKTNKMVEVTTPPKTKRYVYLVTNADPHAEVRRRMGTQVSIRFVLSSPTQVLVRSSV